MFFSVIIPVYNVERYLSDCLNSVFAQTFQDFQIICINDGSTDKSLEILEKFASKTSKITVYNQKNRGLSAARNKGIQEAKGNYLLFLDSDDWIEKNTLELLNKNLLNSNPDILCFKGRIYHEENKNFIEEDVNFEEETLAGWDYYNKYSIKLRKFHFVSCVLRIYQRNFLLNSNLFFKEGIYHEDNQFTPLACYHAKEVKIINHTFYNYRIREGSITQTDNFKRITDKINIANDLCSFFIPISNISKNSIYTVLASDYIGIYNLVLCSQNYNRINEINKLIDFKRFREVCISFRHRFLFSLIFINPILLKGYYRIIKFFR